MWIYDLYMFRTVSTSWGSNIFLEVTLLINRRRRLYSIIIIICYHLFAGCLQLYTWNNPRFYAIQFCSYYVFTISATCNVISHVKYFVLLQYYYYYYYYYYYSVQYVIFLTVTLILTCEVRRALWNIQVDFITNSLVLNGCCIYSYNNAVDIDQAS